MRNNTYRILAEGQLRNNDTWVTGINNNDLIIGPSGAGKTRGYVKPNILQCSESLVVADTKGSLIHEVGPVLKKHGYQVINIDFTDMLSSYGYNPLDYIRYDGKRKTYIAQDIMTIACCLAPIEDRDDAFWEYSARMYLSSLIGYVMECLPDCEHTIDSVVKLFSLMSGSYRMFQQLFEELGTKNPNSFAYQKYQMYRSNTGADKMHNSIIGILGEKLDPLTYDGPLSMCGREKRVDFAQLGRKKTAVFLTVSDTDRSADKLVNLFYTQALQALCRSADQDYPNHRLPVPVRFILDDFATNACIPDFENIISVIRSREIYVSVVIQSLSQLNALYGAEGAKTIINNCDNCLYLGGQDVETAQYISVKANKPADAILNMPLEDAYLFTRGRKPQRVHKYDLRTHERYGELPEARAAAPALEAREGHDRSPADERNRAEMPQVS